MTMDHGIPDANCEQPQFGFIGEGVFGRVGYARTGDVSRAPRTQWTIGVAGRARHGKGASAELIQAYCAAKGIPCQKVSFADPLKDFLISVVGRTEPFRGNNDQRTAGIPELPWENFSKLFLAKALRAFGKPITRRAWLVLLVLPKAVLVALAKREIGELINGRQAMQLFGTEVVRQGFMPDAWVKIAGVKAQLFQGVTVVDDVRFPNEARLKGNGPGIFDNLYKVVRQGQKVIDHPSEYSVDLIPTAWFTMVIKNDGSIAELGAKLDGSLDTNLT